MTDDDQLDQLFDTIDSLCSSSSFSEVDRLLSSVDISGMSSFLIVGWLFICSPAHKNGKLTEYLPFLRRAEKELKKQGKDWYALTRGFE